MHILFLNSNGSVKSTAEINSDTMDGPALSDLDEFGSSVANLGDLDGDGITELAVGAWLGGSGTGQGALHILFLNRDGSVKGAAEINSLTTNGPALSSFDNFGGSIANLGDLNNDGIIELVVGAQGDDTGGTDRGALHILYLQ